MQTEPTRPQGLLARLQARLRGDRYMVNAYPDAATTPDPAPAPAQGAAVSSTTLAG